MASKISRGVAVILIAVILFFFWLVVWLGAIGAVVVAPAAIALGYWLTRSRRRCPDCAALLPGQARQCRYCGCRLEDSDPEVRTDAA